MRLLLALAALCAGVSATSQDSEAREVARVAADAIARALTCACAGRDVAGMGEPSPRARVKEYNNA